MKPQKAQPKYCDVCGSLDIHNGEHNNCKAIKQARQDERAKTPLLCIDLASDFRSGVCSHDNTKVFILPSNCRIVLWLSQVLDKKSLVN